MRFNRGKSLHTSADPARGIILYKQRRIFNTHGRQVQNPAHHQDGLLHRCCKRRSIQPKTNRVVYWHMRNMRCAAGEPRQRPEALVLQRASEFFCAVPVCRCIAVQLRADADVSLQVPFSLGIFCRVIC